MRNIKTVEIYGEMGYSDVDRKSVKRSTTRACMQGADGNIIITPYSHNPGTARLYSNFKFIHSL